MEIDIYIHGVELDQIDVAFFLLRRRFRFYVLQRIECEFEEDESLDDVLIFGGFESHRVYWMSTKEFLQC